MQNPERDTLPKLRGIRRSVSLNSGEIVTASRLSEGRRLPVLMKPLVSGIDLVEWAAQNRKEVEEHLLDAGGILFREFGFQGIESFDRFLRAVCPEGLLEYTFRSTPRTRVQGKIYTSTEYPSDQHIPLHNELAYSNVWPLRIGFYCHVRAATGGQTPIADSRRVYNRIDPSIRQTFVERGVMYVRNYGDLDVRWEDVFQTSDRAEVERFCRTRRIQCEWNGDRLRTRQICQAIATHPVTGDMVWFNQAHLFHLAALRTDVREALLMSLKDESQCPRHAYYGDGSSIEPEVIRRINEIYREESVAFAWQAGDLLLLDNMLTAHGRYPFTGPRRILVGMAVACNTSGLMTPAAKEA